MNKIFTAFIVISFLTCSVIGIKTKSSYIDDTDARIYINNENLEICSIPDSNEEFLSDNKATGLSMLMEHSDYVVRVSIDLECERYLFSEMTVSRVKVLESYKGSVEGYIYVLEPIGVVKFDEITKALSVNGYSWMREGEEYVLFLNRHKGMHIGKDKYIYLPSSASRGQYCITDGSDETDITRKSIKDAFIKKYIEAD